MTSETERAISEADRAIEDAMTRAAATENHEARAEWERYISALRHLIVEARKVAKLEEDLRLAETNGDCIMTLRQELKDEFGPEVECAFFDDVVKNACAISRRRGEDSAREKLAALGSELMALARRMLRPTNEARAIIKMDAALALRDIATRLSATNAEGV